MDQIISCMTREHDAALLLAAALVCGLGAHTAAFLLERAFASALRGRLFRLLAAGGVFGAAVWALHFLAMLAYRPGLPIGYDLGLTGLSVAAAVVLAAGGLALAGLGTAAAALAGGALAGLSITAMHYTGMAGVQVQAALALKVPLVAASVLAGTGLSAPAPLLAAGGRGWRRRLGVAALLTAAVLSLHLTGMAAVVLTPDPTLLLPAAPDPYWLAVAVTAAAVSLLGLCLGASVVEQNLELRAAEERRLRELADAALEGIVIHERGRVLAANGAFARLVGRAEAGLAGARLEDLLAAGALEADAVPRLLEQPASAVEVVARPITYRGRAATALAVRDVSERRWAEAALRRSEERLRLVTDNAPVCLTRCDAEYRYLFVNRACAERLGKRAEEVLGRRIPEVVGRGRLREHQAVRRRRPGRRGGRVRGGNP